MHSRRKIYLIGFMGCGKSTAGEKIADQLGWSFVDLDEEIEAGTGMTIPEIFSLKGEKWFRSAEASVLRSLESRTDTVISTGGGTPCFHDNMDFMMKSGLTVYLRLTPKQLEKRLSGTGDERPLIKDVSKKDLITYIEKKLEEREKWYSRAEIIAMSDNMDDSSLFTLVRDRIQD